MLANRDSYTRRLLRMKTLSADFQIVQAAAAATDKKSGTSAAGTQRSTPKRPPAGCKYSGSQLWLQKPPHRKRKDHRPQQSQPQPQPQPHSVPSASNSPTACTDLETRTCLDRQSSLMDLQTNNSRRGWGAGAGGGFGHRGGVTKSVNNANTARVLEMGEDEDDEDFDFYEDEESSEDLSGLRFQNSNTGEFDEATNENAVAKGANALLKQVTSRQTEIIDTSKLMEEGKFETEYEDPEDEPAEIEETDYKLIDEYEKTFAYARRLRALLNMKFKVADRGSIETNFLLVKAHEHPTQRVIDRWRNVDLGQPYDKQVRMKKLIDDYKLSCNQKKPKKGDTRGAIFPDWIKFHIRFKKDNSEKRWNDFTAYKQKMKKLTGGRVTVPKTNDKYLPAYYDIWSTSLVAYSKPETTLLDVMDPVFAKLGLEARADFKFTVGCFVGDRRAGKAKVQGAPSEAEEVTLQVVCADLYRRSCVEIFVNDNRIEMFQEFPVFYSGPSFVKPVVGAGKDAEKGKKKKKKKAMNQSNLESDEQQQLFVALMPKRSSDQLARATRTRSDPSESRLGGTLATKLSIPEEVVEFDQSSMSDANQNLSMHDCASSDKFETGANSRWAVHDNQVWPNGVLNS